jgi:hypothetical protein
MAEKQLTLNQQLALMPAAVPDSILDFLEDFHHPSALQNQTARDAFDPDYLKGNESALQEKLNGFRQTHGALQSIHVEQSGREIPGGFLLKLGFASAQVGVGILTRMKERTILRVLFQEGQYDENALKELLKNPR